MAETQGKCYVLFQVFALKLTITQGQEFCRDMSYWCKEGHCCGRGKCCTTFDDIWWFWSIWIIVLAVSLLLLWCYFHRRLKLREAGRQTESVHSELVELAPITNRTAQPGNRTPNYSSLFNSEYRTKLPSYNEVQDLPKEPPSYNQLVFTSWPNTSVVHSTLLPPGDDYGTNSCAVGVQTPAILNQAGHTTAEQSIQVTSRLYESMAQGIEPAPQYQDSCTESQAFTPCNEARVDEGLPRSSPPPPYISNESVQSLQSSSGAQQSSLLEAQQ